MAMVRIYLIFTFFFLLHTKGHTQTPCNTPGQNPGSAFPVCGTGVFIQSSVTLCGGRSIPNPKCTPSYDDRNPYYYKFTCFESGTLGFLITPNNASSDYDWQVFDITDRNPNDIFSNISLTVCSNWSGNPGETGTNGSAANLHECGGNTPQYSRWPTLIQGHDYLLMVSHFSNTQSGYRLEFKGGSAVITDPNAPEMKELQIGCGGTEFYLKLNKPVKCSSIAADGSDWEFFNRNVPIASARGVGCNNGFETDSIIITAATQVPVGSFALRSKRGQDGNTLLDLCDNPLPEGQTLVVNRLPSAYTPPDSMVPVRCKPTELELVMKSEILCNSIATDGSDFEITGPATVLITGARQVNCNNGLIKNIRIQLSRPMTLGGQYTLSIRQGSDGNTLLNVCNEPTPAGSNVNFTAYDSVTGRIDVARRLSCTADTITLSHNGANGVTRWRWVEEGVGLVGTSPSITRVYTTENEARLSLEVSNGICTDSGVIVLGLGAGRIEAEFSYPAFACPTDTVLFTNQSKGPVTQWFWDLGNGNTSILENPPMQFYTSIVPLSQVPVTLVATGQNGCRDTVVHTIQVPNNCYVAVPNAFTPNGDGLNDFLYPLNAWKATDLVFRVYNRYGQLVWETTDWTRKWDGRMGGIPAPSGAYAWILQFTEIETGKRNVQKGTTTLIR